MSNWDAEETKEAVVRKPRLSIPPGDQQPALPISERLAPLTCNGTACEPCCRVDGENVRANESVFHFVVLLRLQLALLKLDASV